VTLGFGPLDVLELVAVAWLVVTGFMVAVVLVNEWRRLWHRLDELARTRRRWWG